MPDWFYHPVAKPIFRCLPDSVARGIALTTIGTLGRFNLGRQIIEFLGHMHAPQELQRAIGTMTYDSPVALGRWLDPDDQATAAFACFGFGLIELGPFGIESSSKNVLSHCDAGIRIDQEKIAHYKHYKRPTLDTKIILSLSGDGAACQKMADALDSKCDAFLIEHDEIPQTDLPIFRNILVNKQDNRFTQPENFTGIRLQFMESGNTLPHSLNQKQLDIIQAWRQELGPNKTLIVSGGGLDPQQALDIFSHGADLLMVDSAMLHAGPGLCKRINDALLPELNPIPSSEPPSRHSWFWILLLGISMFIGGVLTAIIAMTNVLLPYDEHYLGMSAYELSIFHERLLQFMAHDRICLAGSMIGIGILYSAIAYFGIKKGNRHAMLAVEASGLIGFFSFFYFIGFGYFDPLHAFVSAILCQLLLLALVAKRSPKQRGPAQDITNDRAWKRSQWGQLLLLIHCAGLLGAGMLISGIGMTDVFVAEDLDFMQCSMQDILAIHPDLINVVAHDRASLGGMLLSCGIAQLFLLLHVWQRSLDFLVHSRHGFYRIYARHWRPLRRWLYTLAALSTCLFRHGFVGARITM